VIEPPLMMLPAKVETAMTMMPAPLETASVPPLTMLPLKSEPPATRMVAAAALDVIVPLLVMPPVKFSTSTTMPKRDAEIMPLLMMLPEKVELHGHRLMPVAALIVPALSLRISPTKH
jgi:hypothetical protein